ncbi:hypothetical protein Dda_6582 [Drechslerella dactyloides]|uniref:Mid2 domain-containing protein n=1 Tax=Drechslerella dactyloides TaxID=74499 RepID=A0AAD6IU13_DREDA|nr:hypothetical protein Dda_6582 [Drechslerella dactyloides]
MRLSAALSTLLLSSSLVHAQVANNDVDFSTVSIYGDLKRCLKAVFVLDYGINGGPVQRKIGCETNDCLCRADTLEQAVVTAGSMAQSQCSNSNDKLSATSILTAYCSDHGFTDVIAVPTGNNAGAAAVTVFATTTVAMVTQTVTVSAASSGLLSPLLLGRGVLFGAATSTSSNSPSPSPSPTPSSTPSASPIVSTVSNSVITTLWQTVTTGPSQTQSSSPQQSSPSDEAPKKSIVGPVVGGVVGGIVVIVGVVFLTIFFMRRSRQRGQYMATEDTTPYSQGFVGGIEDKLVGGTQYSMANPPTGRARLDL